MFLIDAHNDTPYRMYFEQSSLYDNHFQNSIKKQKGFRTLLLYAIFLDPKKTTDFSSPLSYFDALYDNFTKELQKNAHHIEWVTDAAIFPSSQKQQAILTVEGGSLIDSLERVDYLFKKKIKVLTLTWNDSNHLATSQMSGDSGGLTRFGKEVVSRMNALGMLADLSHASDQTFWDVMSVTDKPVLVSHSNARAICNHPRNITDEMFLQLMKNGGVLGINFYPPFLGENANISTLFSHIEHFLELGGENHIGFGSDFDGVDALPAGITDFSSFSDILLEMETRKYSRKLIEKICYKNMMRILA
ncbi:MAG: membrane dipeptidase [Clostridia bacterium]|nr:membrane dipeptidase [Clostridia bacterium]